MALEHGRERAWAGIAAFERHVDDLVAVRDPLQRMQQARLFAPGGEGHAGFLHEHAVQGALADADRGCPLRGAA